MALRRVDVELLWSRHVIADNTQTGVGAWLLSLMLSPVALREGP